jgi:hypothetical protein
VGQSTGSGSAGSEAGHSGTAGRLFSRKHESSPRQRRELPALLHPGRVPQRRHLELPVPTLEPLPTPLALRRNRRTTRPHQTQPRRGRRLLEQPLSHQSNRCPTVSHGSPTAPPSNYWNPGREVQCRQFRCSIRTIRNSCTSCRVTRTTCSTYAAELGF